MKAPRNLDTGNPLYLLAQLNFSQLPQLRGFPAQGLLQFFIDGEDTLYGADYDNPQSQRSWRVRYLPTCRSPHCMPTVSSNPPGMTTRCCRSTTPTPSDG
ncbi:MAG: YwqG family protein [Bifidobacterium bifidum]